MNETPASPAINTVRGTTELLFVVADPVAQLKAPEAFNLIFARCGVDAVVVPARVPAAHLAGFVGEALALDNARGVLVSIPHKTPLMGLLDRFDRVSQAAGAVNAVRRGPDGALEGALFDGAGFVGALRQHEVACAHKRVLLLGAGGAGLAIASALGDAGLAELAVFDAQPARAAQLAGRVAGHSAHPVQATASADPAGFDIVVNATPLGLKRGDALPLDPARLERHAVVMDILMTREPTALQRACRERGITAHPGHEMLIQQMPAYLDFFGYADLARSLRHDSPALLRELRTLMFGGSTGSF
jgi:shikimate dehydrogenase